MTVPIQAGPLAASLRASLRRADVDHAAFALPLARCQPADCRATCCHDGVILDSLESSLLEQSADDHAGALQAMGLDTSQALFATDHRGRRRTTTRPARSEEMAEGFPSHFPQTRCVFLDRDHRCLWQRLAMTQRRHPWHYKPVSCWMHPIALQTRSHGIPALLTLAGDPDDPSDFATATPCRRPCPAAPPARETLAEELALLGLIAGRDFQGELQAGDSRSPVSKPARETKNCQNLHTPSPGRG